jgi:hypothetical protein
MGRHPTRSPSSVNYFGERGTPHEPTDLIAGRCASSGARTGCKTLFAVIDRLG